MSRAICLLLITLLLGGCASFYNSRYPNNNYAPTNAENIQILNDYPSSPYEIIGKVGAEGASASKWSTITKKMQVSAAQMGGDAIVIQFQADGEQSLQSALPGCITTLGVNKKVMAEVIKFKK